MNPKTGNREVRFANFQLIYPRRDVEYSCEELRARHRGWLNVDWVATRKRQQEDAVAAARVDAEDASVSQQDSPTPQGADETNVNVLVYLGAESAPNPEPLPLDEANKQSSNKLQIHIDAETPPLLSENEKRQNAKLQIHVDEEESPKPISPAQNAQKKASKAFAVLADEVPKLQTTPLAEQQAGVEIPKAQTVPLKGFEDEMSLNDENMPPSQLEAEKAKATKKARREERSNRTRKIKVMEVKEIRNETQTSEYKVKQLYRSGIADVTKFKQTWILLLAVRFDVKSWEKKQQ